MRHLDNLAANSEGCRSTFFFDSTFRIIQEIIPTDVIIERRNLIQCFRTHAYSGNQFLRDNRVQTASGTVLNGAEMTPSPLSNVT